ncbi:Protein of unknown function [Pyronema omphalodes CBS 100304]|uniref:Uncharacterized protein n=1 Tax=Pyronema omphalodes (strain CBS 100304) TaxID=1076935 RepID=U4L5A5_PYROM|nr:Protein of unknown function [Pyronema omphalodes CBS 100304]
MAQNTSSASASPSGQSGNAISHRLSGPCITGWLERVPNVGLGNHHNNISGVLSSVDAAFTTAVAPVSNSNATGNFIETMTTDPNSPNSDSAPTESVFNKSS